MLAQVNKTICSTVDLPESTEIEQCFGRKAVLLCGDMYQFPPIIPRTPLYSSIVRLFGNQTGNKQRAAAVAARMATTPEMIGAKLFVQFRKTELTQQMRAAGNPLHMNLINTMRQPEPDMNSIVNALENEYQTLSSHLLDMDPEFIFCPIATTSNRERATINDCMSKIYAKVSGQPRFVWFQPIHAKDMSLTPQTADSIYKRHDIFKSYFVVGAPAMLTQNICCKRALANGTSVNYHSLILDDQEDTHQIQDLIRQTQPGDDIFLRYPPQFINVSLNDRDPQEFNGLTLVKGKPVIPIGKSIKGNRVKTYVKQNSGTTEISSSCHGVDLRFSITMHKVQGKTVRRLCADLNDHSFQP